MERRNFIKASALSGAFLMACKTTPVTNSKNAPVSRFVHITDMHLYNNEIPEKGINNLLSAIDNLSYKPDFILNTGDNIMDALKRSKEEVELQWSFWKENFRDRIKYPLYNCIGNHDVWGWNNPDEGIKSDPLYGKAWAKKMLEIPANYYSVELNGWKLICLDSPFYEDNSKGYTAKFGKQQLEWLKKELASTPESVHVALASHIPILSPCVFYDGDNESTGNWRIPGAWMHIDSREVKDILKAFNNVKLAVSGHVHLVDEAKYLRVNYVCNGAACGGWWKGNYQEFAPAFTTIDLFEDGSFENTVYYYNLK